MKTKQYNGMSTDSSEFKKIEKEVLANLWKALAPKQVDFNFTQEVK